MNIFVLGLNHKTAPIKIREAYSFKTAELPHALQLLKGVEEVIECLILSTCNRVELYVLNLSDDVEPILEFLAAKNPSHPLNSEGVRDNIYVYRNSKALEHICAVASGLDSMVLGEPQIFGQLKNAYNQAIDQGTAGFVFRSLFPQVFSLVKKIHSTTDIGRASLSVSYAAVKLTRQILPNLHGCRAMILGAGEMGEHTLRNLMSNGLQEVYVCNRTFEKAVRLAADFGGIPIMFHEFTEYLQTVDILISSIDADAFILDFNEAERLQFPRGNKPLIIIDISVPRSIDPEIAKFTHFHLYNIDDLISVVNTNSLLRSDAAQKARTLIKAKVDAILQQLKAEEIESAIISLKSAAEAIRREQLCRLQTSLNLAENQKALLESFSKSLAGQIVHESILRVREYVNTMKYK